MSAEEKTAVNEFKKPKDRGERTSQLFVLPPDLLLKLGINLAINKSEPSTVPVKSTKHSSKRMKPTQIKTKHLKGSNKYKQNVSEIPDNDFGTMPHTSNEEIIHETVQVTQDNKFRNIKCESGLNQIIHSNSSRKIIETDQKIVDKPYTVDVYQEINTSITDTSILETSCLLKESVLLSPTFIADRTELSVNKNVRHEDFMAPVTSNLPENNPTIAILEEISMPITKKVNNKCMVISTVESQDSKAVDYISHTNCIGYNNQENINKPNSDIEALKIQEVNENKTVHTEPTSIPPVDTQIFPLPEDLHIVDAVVDIIQMLSDGDSNIKQDAVREITHIEESAQSVKIVDNIPIIGTKSMDYSAGKSEMDSDFNNIKFCPITDDTADEAYSSDSINEVVGENINEMWDYSCNTIDESKLVINSKNFTINSAKGYTKADMIPLDSIISKNISFHPPNNLNDTSCGRLKTSSANNAWQDNIDNSNIDETLSQSIEQLNIFKNAGLSVKEIVDGDEYKSITSCKNKPPDICSKICKNPEDANSLNTLTAEKISHNAVSNISSDNLHGSDENDKYVPIIAKYLRRAVKMLSLNRKHEVNINSHNLNKSSDQKCHTSNNMNTQGVEKRSGEIDSKTRFIGLKKPNTYKNMKIYAAIPKIDHKGCELETCTSVTFDEPLFRTSDIDVFETEIQSTRFEFSLNPHFGQITYYTDLNDIQSELEWSVQHISSDKALHEQDTLIKSHKLATENIEYNTEKLNDTKSDCSVFTSRNKDDETIKVPSIDFFTQDGIRKEFLEFETNNSCIVSIFQEPGRKHESQNNNKANSHDSPNSKPSLPQDSYKEDFQFTSTNNMESETLDEPNVSISDHSEYLSSSFIEKINNSGVSWTDIQGLVTDCNFPSDFCRSSRENSISHVENECESTSNAESDHITLRDLGLLEEKQQYSEVEDCFEISYKLNSIEHFAPTSLPREQVTNQQTIIGIPNEDDTKDEDARLDIQINEILDTHFSNDESDFDAFEDCVGDDDIARATSNLENTDSTVIELLTIQDGICEGNTSESAHISKDVNNVFPQSFSKNINDFGVVGNPDLLLLPFKKREVVMCDRYAHKSNTACDKMANTESIRNKKDMVGTDKMQNNKLDTNLITENASLQENETAGALNNSVTDTVEDRPIKLARMKKSDKQKHKVDRNSVTLDAGVHENETDLDNSEKNTGEDKPNKSARKINIKVQIPKVHTNFVTEIVSMHENETTEVLDNSLENAVEDKPIKSSLKKNIKAGTNSISDVPYQNNDENKNNESNVKVREVTPIRRGRGRPPKRKIKMSTNDSLNVEIPEKVRKVQKDITLEKNTASVVKCGVCYKDIEHNSWMAHCTEEHNYLAWADGDPPITVSDGEAMVKHLQNILQSVSPLVCTLCGVTKTNAKKFWKHMETCLLEKNKSSPSTASGKRQRRTKSVNMSMESDVETSKNLNDTLDTSIPTELLNDSSCNSVTCGVCKWQGSERGWFDHLCKEHEYLAWKEEDKPVDTDTEEKLHAHLKLVLGQFSKLTCKRCGLDRKYLKAYLKHVKICEEPQQQNETLDDSESILNENDDTTLKSDSDDEIIFTTTAKRRRISSYDETDNISLKSMKKTDKPLKCGRCQEQVQSYRWLEHTRMKHDYVAWKDGEEPIDVSDQKCIKRHLLALVKKTDGLVCRLCNSTLTTANGFIYHINKCQIAKSSAISGTSDGKVRRGPFIKTFVPTMEDPTTDTVKCAVCSKVMINKRWKNHLKDVHYNLAWFEGGTPLDLDDHYKCTNILTDLIKLLMRPLVCRECGASRMSGAGFYAHMIICQKTEEEIDAMKYTCEICKRKFLPMYRVQHAATHRINVKPTSDTNDTGTVEPDVSEPCSRRRAAVAAKANIEKITSDLIEGQHSCTVCGFLAYTKEKYDNHKCDKTGLKSEEVTSDDNMSNNNCGRYQSESEESESDVDSNVSAEEHDSIMLADEAEGEKKEKRDREFDRKAYKIGEYDFFYRKSCFADYMKEFCTTYFTKESLFLELKCNKFAQVSSHNLDKYLPPLKQSCQTSIFTCSSDKINWKTFEVFQSEYKNGLHAFFAGGPISALSWAPPVDRLSMIPTPQYAALTCQRDPSLCGLAHDQIFSHPGLIQIWSFENFDKNKSAKFVLGLAHDYGTIWSLDWCPSGAREEPDTTDEEPRRLGLLAAGCSNGSAYIFAVRHPTGLGEGLPIYKTSPVMELRLCSGGHGRKAMQVTAVHWSMQKGHSTVAVGYVDGTVALYNLNINSPILRTTEDNVTVMNPYFDSQLVKASVSGVTIYPTQTQEKSEGVTLAVSSCNGVVALCRTGAAPTTMIERRMTCTGVMFAPHWPTVIVSSDDLSTGVMAMDWCGDPQRVCVASAAAVCMHTSRLAAATPVSQLILARGMHPAATKCKKQVIGTYGLSPLHVSKWAKKKANDNLEVTLEPNTYDEVIQKYGITFNSTRKFKIDRIKPDQYPLASITHLAFCPSIKNFNRLAFANAAGIVFVKTL